jgi:hypothetical protein
MDTLIQHSLLNDINRVTQMIYKEFPALYAHLQETPLSLATDLKEMSHGELTEYLESLKMQWTSYSKVHGIRKFMSDTTYLKHYIQLIYHPVCTT